MHSDGFGWNVVQWVCLVGLVWPIVLFKSATYSLSGWSFYCCEWGVKVPKYYCIVVYFFCSVWNCFIHLGALIWMHKYIQLFYLLDGLTSLSLYNELHCVLTIFILESILFYLSIAITVVLWHHLLEISSLFFHCWPICICKSKWVCGRQHIIET